MSTAPARRSAIARARTHIGAAQLAAQSAARSRKAAERLAEEYGFYVGADAVGDQQCPHDVMDGCGAEPVYCLLPKGHEGECL